MAQHIINVELLGGFHCYHVDKRCELPGGAVAKSMQMLALLMYYYPRPVSRDIVREELYRNEDSNADNSLKTLLFRVRKGIITEFGIPVKDAIELENGQYRITDVIEIQSDVRTFREACAEAEGAQTKEAAICAMERAVAAYHGELLPELSDVEWVVYENAECTDTYCKLVQKLCHHYNEQSEYEKSYACYQNALKYFPFEDSFMAGCIDALTAQGKYRQAEAEYERLTSILFDELGAYPSEELVATLRRIGDKMAGTVLDGKTVSAALDEESNIGAYYCNYPSFVDSYRIMRRIIDRDQIEASLVMITLVDRQGLPLEDTEQIITAMSTLRVALTKTLRRSDMFTRFSKAQLLVMLWNTPRSNADVPMERIRERIEFESKETDCRFICNVLDSTEPPLPQSYQDGKRRKRTWRKK